MSTDLTSLAERLVDGLSRYDAEAVRALLGPGFLRWLNLTRSTSDADELMSILDRERAAVSESRFTILSIDELAAGFVVQLQVTGRTTAGVAFDFAVCLIGRVEADRLARLDEYVDGRQVAPLLAANR